MSVTQTSVRNTVPHSKEVITVNKVFYNYKEVLFIDSKIDKDNKIQDMMHMVNPWIDCNILALPTKRPQNNMIMKVKKKIQFELVGHTITIVLRKILNHRVKKVIHNEVMDLWKVFCFNQIVYHIYHIHYNHDVKVVKHGVTIVHVNRPFYVKHQ